MQANRGQFFAFTLPGGVASAPGPRQLRHCSGAILRRSRVAEDRTSLVK